MSIYILKLVSNKYYVGKIEQTTYQAIKNRFLQHLNKNGAYWTKLYKPVEIMEHYVKIDNFDEDKYTVKMMDKYGINNVRGGSFVTKKLTNEQISVIKQMIKGSNDKCFKCGNPNHFAKTCNSEIEQNKKSNNHYRRVKTDINNDDDCDNNSDNNNDNNNNSGTKESIYYKCYRCGRKGHYVEDCYASKHIKGYYLNNWLSDSFRRSIDQFNKNDYDL